MGENIELYPRLKKGITCVTQPGSEYLGHKAVSSGNSYTIASAIIDFTYNKNIISELQAVRCYGTVVNIGRKNGVIFFLSRATTCKK